LKKTLSLFSIRPTIAAVSNLSTFHNPLYSNFSYTNRIKIERIPTANLFITSNPYSPNRAAAIDLQKSFTQTDWFYEDGQLIPKTRETVYSDQVIMFTINRRFNASPNFNGVQMGFTSFPMTYQISNILNDTPVIFGQQLLIGKEYFKIKSSVLLDTMDGGKGDGNRIIIGTSCMIARTDNYNNKEFVWYTPEKVGQSKYDYATKTYYETFPIYTIDEHTDPITGDPGFMEYSERYATILMFTKEEWWQNILFLI